MNPVAKINRLLLLLSIVSSCTFLSKDDSTRKILIDNSNISEKKDILDLIDTIEISSIKEFPGSYIGDPFKIFIKEDRIIIFDRIHAKKINLYDLKGNFIRNLLKVGDSIDAPLQINDCWLNFKGELEAYDFSTKHIYQFDSLYNQKRIVRGDKKYLFMSVIRAIGSKDYVGYTNFDNFNAQYEGNFFHIGFLDSNLALKSATFNYDESYRGMLTLSYRVNLFYLNDTIRLVCPNDNSIYNVNDNSTVNTYVKLEYKENSLPSTQELYGNVLKPDLPILLNTEKAIKKQTEIFSKYAFFDGIWFESPDWIYLTSRNTNYTSFITMINKKSGYLAFSTQLLYVSGRYDFNLPAFKYYEPKTNCYYSIFSGDFIYKYQRGHLSRFLVDNNVQDSPTILYVIKCKFKK